MDLNSPCSCWPGFWGGVGQILLTSSYRHGDASLIAPFDYTSMIIALAVGYFVFAEVPTFRMLAGAALIVAAGLAIILRERKLGLQRGARQGDDTARLTPNACQGDANSLKEFDPDFSKIRPCLNPST